MALENFKGKQNSNGFLNRPHHINKNGRPLSIRNELNMLLQGDENYLVKKEMIKNIFPNGDIEIDIPNSNKLALRLIELANGNNGNISLKAIKIIMEQTEGKPTIIIEQTQNEPYDLSLLSDKELELLKSLLKKASIKEV